MEPHTLEQWPFSTQWLSIGCVVPCCTIIYGDIPFGSSGNLTKAGDPHESSATWTGDSVMGRVTLGTGPPDFFEPQNSCELWMFIPPKYGIIVSV